MLISCSPKIFWKNDALSLNAPLQISSHQETLGFSMLNLPYFPKQDNQSYQSQKASRALPHRQRAMAAKVCQSNYNIFKTLPYGLRLPANIFAVCLPAFSVAPEILTPCPWSKPLLGLFEFAPCFSHSLSVFHAAVKLSFLFTVILLVRINRRFWSIL